MPIAKSFEKDVFISYCHADNDNPMGEGWIDLLHRNLRTRLIQLLGARTPDDEPAIWRDDSLHGNESFSRVLDEKLRQVAVVISVVSPSYVKSDWCRDEIEIFCRAAQTRVGLSPANKQRILKVLKTPVDRSHHPPVLQSQTGFPFFTLDPSNNRAREYSLTRGDENAARALEVINDLAYSVIDTLEAINASENAAQGSASPRTGDGSRRVYLALAHWEFDEARQQLRRELASRGFTVVPPGELPLHNPEVFKREVRAALQGCSLSVHAVSARRSAVLPDEREDVVALQMRLAAEYCTDGDMQRIIWMPDERMGGVRVDDPQHKAFLDILARDITLRQGAELLSATLQGLIERILDTLRKKATSAAASAEIGGSAAPPPSVYLIWHPLDEALADPLREHLFEAGFDVRDPLSDPAANESQIFEDHRMKLMECTAALLCVGRAGEFWLSAQLSDMQKAVGWRGSRPLAARGVLLGPPADAYKRRLRVHGVLTIDSPNGFSAAALQPFIQQIIG